MEATKGRVDILLVDDSPAILRLLMDLLEGQSYDVRVAVDAIVMQALSSEPARRPGAREFANQFVIALLSAPRPD